MKLSEILSKGFRLTLKKGDPNERISYIFSDSRKTGSGDIFCVYAEFGEKTADFISSSLLSGCTTVIVGKDSQFISEAERFQTVLISVEDPRDIHGPIAHFISGEPSRSLKIIAVTGTNGKTSVTHILYDLFLMQGKKSGLIGTINAKFDGKTIDTGFTTPDPSNLNLLLKEMRDAGIEFVFLEASSHGLKLGRLNGIHLQSAVFTNQTQDHMDFHPDIEDYRKSKFQLFELLETSSAENKFAVIALDSPGGKEMQGIVEKGSFSYPVIYFGGSGNFSGDEIELSLNGTKYNIHRSDTQESVRIETNLLGNFNYLNTALAYIVSLRSGLSQTDLIRDLKNIPFVKGRFEIVSNSDKTKIAIVDYAHTPDALNNILSSIREIPHSKLITIFGCGGDRDKTKRSVMAGISQRFSDFVIITSDNPRTEDPETILDDIEKGFSGGFTSYLRIEDRKTAIAKGLSLLPEGGFLLVAGKGHEDYQIRGRIKEHFSDREELQNAFAIADSGRK